MTHIILLNWLQIFVCYCLILDSPYVWDSFRYFTCIPTRLLRNSEMPHPNYKPDTSIPTGSWEGPDSTLYTNVDHLLQCLDLLERTVQHLQQQCAELSTRTVPPKSSLQVHHQSHFSDGPRHLETQSSWNPEQWQRYQCTEILHPAYCHTGRNL